MKPCDEGESSEVCNSFKLSVRTKITFFKDKKICKKGMSIYSAVIVLQISSFDLENRRREIKFFMTSALADAVILERPVDPSLFGILQKHINRAGNIVTKHRFRSISSLPVCSSNEVEMEKIFEMKEQECGKTENT
jgi:hypothetical protein